jgi:integrase
LRGRSPRSQRRQAQIRQAAGSKWQDNDLVFPSQVGTPSDASHIRRSFRRVVQAAGLNPGEWTPRELRHSFVSLLSDAGMPIEQISRLVGHSGTTTTETIYRNPRELHRMSEVWTVCRVRSLPESVLAGHATRCLAWVLASASR